MIEITDWKKKLSKPIHPSIHSSVHPNEKSLLRVPGTVEVASPAQFSWSPIWAFRLKTSTVFKKQVTMLFSASDLKTCTPMPPTPHPWPSQRGKQNSLLRVGLFPEGKPKAPPSPPPQGASLVAQIVNNLPPMQETRVRSLGQEDPQEKGMATHCSTLAWRIPWTEEPGVTNTLRAVPFMERTFHCSHQGMCLFKNLWKNPHPESVWWPWTENGISLSGKDTNSSPTRMASAVKGTWRLLGFIYKVAKWGYKTVYQIPSPGDFPVFTWRIPACLVEYLVRGEVTKFQGQFVPSFYSLLTELCAVKHFQKTVKM